MRTCQECGAAFPGETASTGRPRLFCSTTCRSAARRARVRSRNAAESARARRCSAVFAGRQCARDAVVTISLDGTDSRVCAECRDVTVLFLVQQGVPATSVRVSATGDVARPAPAPETAPAAPARIVMIEDNDRLGHGIRAALARHGYQVRLERFSIGAARGPVTVKDGEVTGLTVQMRRMRSIDPPLAISLGEANTPVRLSPRVPEITTEDRLLRC